MKKVALLLLLAPLVLAACGGGSRSTKIDPVAYVKHAASKTAGLKSEHMVMSASISAGPTAIKMNGSGDFSNGTKQGRMSMGMTLMGRDINMTEVIDGTTIYIKSPMFSSRLPGGESWMKIDLQKAGSSNGIDYSSLMSQSPTQALQRLEAAGSVKTVGTETIDGVETTHYQVTNLDLSKMPQGAKLASIAHPKFGPVDVWIGNTDGYVHRESLSFKYSVGGQSASMSVRVDLSKFGENVDVTVPPASDVLDATSLSGGGFGG